MKPTARRPRTAAAHTPQPPPEPPFTASSPTPRAMRIHPLQFSSSSLLAALPPSRAGLGKRTVEPPSPRKVLPCAPEPPRDAALAPLVTYTMDEVCAHDTEEAAWIVVRGKVYDCTSFIDAHPGGVVAILLKAGEDVTEEFVDTHSRKAVAMLERFCIGRVVEGHVSGRRGGLRR